MARERLLTRIAGAGMEYEHAGKSAQEILLADVLEHLTRILNTRQGSVPIAIEYGVPNFHAMGSRFSTDPMESAGDIRAGILGTVKSFEPRLRVLSGKFLEKKDFDVNMVMEIEAELLAGEGDLPLTLRLNIRPEGKIEVSA